MSTETLVAGIALAGFLFVSPADSQAPAHTSPARYEVSIEKNVPAIMRDGTVLRSDVYHPRTPGRFPALLQRTPYSKNGPRAAQEFSVLAGRGFVVVIQDSAGATCRMEGRGRTMRPRTASTPSQR